DAGDVRDVYRVAGEAVARARSGAGPSLLEVTTRRFEGHYIGDGEKYRNEERSSRRRLDPLAVARSSIEEQRLLDAGDLEALEADVLEAVEAAAAFALQARWPSGEQVSEHVYAGAYPADVAGAPACDTAVVQR
ncbi:MAG TPA: thiamine pyrophosphate-dependent enzyme, partial [Acidimicrobiales bacterium]|nr:thiamine pyrophosphate-dependent enzyme [Acidimicrobiales bacterium]